MLPGDVDTFLRKHVDSIEGLELLLLLHFEPDTTWTAPQCSDRLGIPRAICQRQLDFLTVSGLIAAEGGGLRYRPRTAELRQQVQRLVEVYGVRRIEVVNSIIGRSLDRIRELADAFRLRKDKPDG